MISTSNTLRSEWFSHLPFFLSPVANAELNHWSKQVVSTRFAMWDPRIFLDQSRPIREADPASEKNSSQSLVFVGWHAFSG